jgi:hypothetical protein
MSQKASSAQAARQWLQEHLASHELAFKDFLADAIDIRQLVLEYEFPYQPGPLPPVLSGIVLPLLLSWAETTVAGHYFLRRIIAGLVRSSEPVPEAWRKFHGDVLDGTTLEPPSPKGRKAVHEQRNELIALLVVVLQIQFGLPRLANPTRRTGDSALEIVKDELVGLLPDLRAIEVDALERAMMRRTKDHMTDPILGVIAHRT